MKQWISGAVMAVGLGLALAGHASPGQRKQEIRVEKFFGKGRLGLQIAPMSDDLRAFFGAPAGNGLLVDSVVADTPAKIAGIKAGDVVLEVAGQKVTDIGDVYSALATKKKGDTAVVTVLRDKKKLSFVVTLKNDAPPPMAYGPQEFSGYDMNPWQGWSNPALEKRLEDLEMRLEGLEKKK